MVVVDDTDTDVTSNDDEYDNDDDDNDDSYNEIQNHTDDDTEHNPVDVVTSNSLFGLDCTISDCNNLLQYDPMKSPKQKRARK